MKITVEDGEGGNGNFVLRLAPRDSHDNHIVQKLKKRLGVQEKGNVIMIILPYKASQISRGTMRGRRYSCQRNGSRSFAQ